MIFDLRCSPCSVVVATPTDGAPCCAEQFKDQSDDEQDDANRPEHGDTGDETDDEQNQSDRDHVRSLPGMFFAAGAATAGFPPCPFLIPSRRLQFAEIDVERDLRGLGIRRRFMG
jgi:hypothetical protein